MATRKNTKKATGRAHRSGAEYRLVIDAYSPEKIPMARLAEYMRQFADILGEPAAVHFARLETGSTVLVSKVEREAVPKVKKRVFAVRRREGPSEGVRAYKAINRLLRDDNAVAVLKEDKKTSTIIRFPGREEIEEEFPVVTEHGSIDGVIVRIGGKDDTVHVTLESEGEQVTGCYTTRQVALDLRHQLFEPVRLFGRGRWARDNEGRWSLDRFKIDTFEALDDAPLSEALVELQAIKADWGPDPLAELPAIRHGPRNNGRH